MKQSFLQSVFVFLNKNTNYAVLRNYEGLPDKNNGRDIDIIINKNDFDTKKKALCDIIISNNYYITLLYRSEKMCAIMCANSCGDVIHFDFLFETSLYGIVFITSDDILKDRVFNGALYHASLEYVFLDKYIYLKSLNCDYPIKYEHIRREVEERGYIDSIIKKITCYNTFKELDSKSTICMNSNMLLYNLQKRPLSQIKQIISNLYYNIRNRINLVGLSIAFTGADGVGKTTVIDNIIQILSQTTRVQLYHHRPTIMSNMGEVAHNVGLKKSVDRDYDKPHRANRKSVINSLLRLIYYSADYILGHVFKIRKQLFKREIVIFDRYYNDVIVDSRRSAIFLPVKFLYNWGRIFIPKMKYNFLITADPDVILSRKQELDRGGIEKINSNMEYLSNKKGYYLIKNNGTAQECVSKILTTIFEQEHKRNLKRI